MPRLTSVLTVDYSVIRLVLFEGKDRRYFAEKFLAYDGFGDKGFHNPEDVFIKIQRLFKTCEEEYGFIDRRTTVLLPGIFYRYGVFDADIAIPNGTVTESEVNALLDSCGVSLPGYTATEKEALNYKSFTNPVMTDPIGEKTDRLYLTASVGYLMDPIKELIDNCAKKLGRYFDIRSYCSVVAAKSDAELTKGGQRVIIILSSGHTDVVLTKGAVAVDVRSDLWGETHVKSALSDLTGLDDHGVDRLLKQTDLNIFFDNDDMYYIDGKPYPVAEVNALIIEAMQYYAKEIAKLIADMLGENKLALYLTGSSVCENRGVKELFEEELGQDLNVIRSEVLNLEGCADYVTAAAQKTDSGKESVFTRVISSITNRRK